VKPHVLAAICPDTLRPLSKAEVYRRAARREQIRREQERVSKLSESDVPPEQRRQVIDLHELYSASKECAVACLLAAPVACTLVYLQLSA
jgi:hypothetical protein